MQLCYLFHVKKESKEEERLLNRKFPMSQTKDKSKRKWNFVNVFTPHRQGRLVSKL